MNIVCFDIGGTNIKYGLLDEQGFLRHYNTTKTPTEKMRISVEKIITDIIFDLQKQYKIDGIGIASVGVVDKNKILYCTRFPDFTDYNLAEIISNKTNLSCSLINDADAVRISEQWLGNAINIDNCVITTVGTGLGMTIIINGKVYKGHNLMAGSFGYGLMNNNEIWIDKFASTKALENNYEAFDGSKCNGKEIVYLAENNNLYAQLSINRMIKYLSRWLCNIAYILDPQRILVGGGISESKYFFDKLEKEFYNKCVFPHKVELMPTKFGNKSALYGGLKSCLDLSQ